MQHQLNSDAPVEREENFWAQLWADQIQNGAAGPVKCCIAAPAQQQRFPPQETEEIVTKKKSEIFEKFNSRKKHLSKRLSPSEQEREKSASRVLRRRASSPADFKKSRFPHSFDYKSFSPPSRPQEEIAYNNNHPPPGTKGNSSRSAPERNNNSSHIQDLNNYAAQNRIPTFLPTREVPDGMRYIFRPVDEDFPWTSCYHNPNQGPTTGRLPYHPSLPFNGPSTTIHQDENVFLSGGQSQQSTTSYLLTTSVPENIFPSLQQENTSLQQENTSLFFVSLPSHQMTSSPPNHLTSSTVCCDEDYQHFTRRGPHHNLMKGRGKETWERDGEEKDVGQGEGGKGGGGVAGGVQQQMLLMSSRSQQHLLQSRRRHDAVHHAPQLQMPLVRQDVPYLERDISFQLRMREEERSLIHACGGAAGGDEANVVPSSAYDRRRGGGGGGGPVVYGRNGGKFNISSDSTKSFGGQSRGGIGGDGKGQTISRFSYVSGASYSGESYVRPRAAEKGPG